MRGALIVLGQRQDFFTWTNILEIFHGHFLFRWVQFSFSHLVGAFAIYVRLHTPFCKEIACMLVKAKKAKEKTNPVCKVEAEREADSEPLFICMAHLSLLPSNWTRSRAQCMRTRMLVCIGNTLAKMDQSIGAGPSILQCWPWIFDLATFCGLWWYHFSCLGTKIYAESLKRKRYRSYICRSVDNIPQVNFKYDACMASLTKPSPFSSRILHGIYGTSEIKRRGRINSNRRLSI